VILCINGVDHPLLDYQEAHVPTVLASDEGGAGTDLSEQFLLTMRRYRLSYGAHKTMARNSLEYSFLPGQRLWAPDSYRTRTNACRSRRAPSTGRKAFLASSAKARQQWQLEIDLDRFE
jgi:adenosine deaminase/adenosine deaminase CECR1